MNGKEEGEMVPYSTFWSIVTPVHVHSIDVASYSLLFMFLLPTTTPVVQLISEMVD